MNRTRWSVGMSAVAVLALAACSGSGTAEDPDTSATSGTPATDELTPVAIGLLPILDSAPLHVGLEQGFFEDEGIDLTIEPIQGGPAGVAAVTTGDLQFSFTSPISFFQAHSQGIELVYAGAAGSSTGDPEADVVGFVAAPGSDITSAADLEGRSVAVNTINNIAEVTLRQSLQAVGVDPADVEFVELPLPEMLPAMENGQVDAAWTSEPFRTFNLQAGATFVVPSAVDASDGSALLLGMYFTSAQYAADEPETMAAFSRALERSAQFSDENPDVVRETVLGYTEVPEAVVDDLVLPRFSVDGSDRAQLEHWLELVRDAGLLEGDIDLEELMP